MHEEKTTRKIMIVLICDMTVPGAVLFGGTSLGEEKNRAWGRYIGADPGKKRSNATLYVNVVDIERAFDGIQRDTLWRILCHKGVHRKL